MTEKNGGPKQDDIASAETLPPPAPKEAEGRASRDPPIGWRGTIYFSLDDFMAPALREELERRGWQAKYGVAKLDLVRHGERMDGVNITLERIE